jgi:pyrroloquinoline quinone biosynthesis protein B
LAWAGDARVRWRTQSSLAVSADGKDWLLLNASPDIRQQIAATPALHPQEGARHSPIAAVLVTNGDVDHVAGLLGLREKQPFVLHGTAEVLQSLSDNRIFDVMDHDVVRRQAVVLGRHFSPLPGLVAKLIAVPGKVPLWQERGEPVVGAATETTVGVLLSANGRRLAYIPGCAALTPEVRQAVAGVDLLLFDGTLWRDDEMVQSGLGTKTGQRMGHLSMSGPEGSMAALANVAIGRRVFVHINNTNLALIDGSAERRAIEESGWAVAHDGMAFTL